MSANQNFRYTLQKYRRPADKHTCPGCGRRACFKYYVDNSTGTVLSPEVGRCDHESSCGYHYTPHQYFTDHPQQKESNRLPLVGPKPTPKPSSAKPTPPSYLPAELVAQMQTSTRRPSDLVGYLLTQFTQKLVDDVCALYKLGLTRDSRTIYWQIDSRQRVRTGLIMRYTPDGHRDRSGRPGAFDWVHSLMRRRGLIPDEDYSLRQCLFGEHLLADEAMAQKAVGVVESAKSAVICAAFCPQLLWVATCGKNQFKPEVMVALRGRKVMAFPDLDGYDRWEQAAQADDFRAIDFATFRIIDLHAIELPPTLGPTADLADVMLASARDAKFS